MKIRRDQTFTGKTVRLDGTEFRNCRFEGCTIEVAGEQRFGLVDCIITHCSWRLVGPAERTLVTLHELYHGLSDGAMIVDHWIDNIRQADPFAPTITPSA